MKVIYIECDAEELKANRTMLDNLAEVFSSITRAIGGVNITSEMLAKTYEDTEGDEESEECG